MKQSTHGLVQSQDLTLAAQRLTAAKEYLAEHDGDLLGEQRLFSARAAYNAAYRLYTNPFNTPKGVWPDGTRVSRAGTGD